MTGSNFWSIFLSICSSTASRETFAWSAKSCSRFLVCSENSLLSRASVIGFKFRAFSDWGLGMENKTGGLTLLSICSWEKLSKHSCGFPRPSIAEFGRQRIVLKPGRPLALSLFQWPYGLPATRGNRRVRLPAFAKEQEGLP